MIYTVAYSIGTYSGTVEVNESPNADTEVVLAKAKRVLRQRAGGTLPFGSTSFEITNQREVR